MERAVISELISAPMAAVIGVVVAGVVVFLCCAVAQIVPGTGNSAIENILARNPSASLPPFILNGSVVAVNNGQVNVSAIEHPSDFLTYANATSSNVRALVSRQGNWTEIPWDSYPVLIENLHNASQHNGTDCNAFKVPDAPSGCEFEQEWHENCSYPRLRCNCSTNEVFSYCGSHCGSNCGDNLTLILCPAVCSQGCFCAPGYKRNASGHCVVQNACPPKINCPVYKMVQPPPNCTYALVLQENGCYIRELQCNDTTCSANMTMSNCGSHCPNTCGMNPDEIMCTKDCRTGCFCKANYWFNPLSGSCVAKKDCPTKIASDPTCSYPDLPDAPEGCHYEDQVQYNKCPMPTLRCNKSESGSNDLNGNLATLAATIGGVAEPAMNVTSYTNCIMTVLRKNGYKGANLNIQQLAQMASAFDKSLVTTIIGRVNETCGEPPSDVLKNFKLLK